MNKNFPKLYFYNRYFLELSFFINVQKMIANWSTNMNPNQNQGNMQNSGTNPNQQMFDNFNIKAQGFKSNIEKVQSQYGEILKRKADIQKREEALLKERSEVNNAETKVSSELMNLTMSLYSHYQEIISVTGEKTKHDQMEITKAQAEIIYRKRAEARHRGIAETAQTLMFESAKRADEEKEFRYKIAEKQKMELEKAKAEQDAAAKKIQEELRNQFGSQLGAPPQQQNQAQQQQQRTQAVAPSQQQNQAPQQQQQRTQPANPQQQQSPVSPKMPTPQTSNAPKQNSGGFAQQGTVAAQVHTTQATPEKDVPSLDKTKKYSKATGDNKAKDIINDKGGDTTRGGNIYQNLGNEKRDSSTPPPTPVMGESKSKMKNTFFNTEESSSSKLPKSDIFDKTTLGTKSTLPNIKKDDIFGAKK